jgi:hypothetical protein
MNGEALGCASGNMDKVPSHLLLAHASGQLKIWSGVYALMAASRAAALVAFLQRTVKQ